MKNNFSILNSIYKPKKITLKNSVYIFQNDDYKYVIKKKNNNILKIHDYLKSCNFNNYIKVIDNNRCDYFVYDYIDSFNIPDQKKVIYLSNVVALMHAKTSYTKRTDKSLYDNIYNDINNNLEYANNFYSNLYDSIFLKKYYNPFDSYFMDIYSKINNCIGFCKRELSSWYNLVSEYSNQRVCLVHNNLSINHYIRNNDDYLISFDNAKIDTPVLDIYNFYKKEYNKFDFNEFLDNYFYHFKYNDDEKKLLFILISIPDVITITSSNYSNLKNLHKVYDYILNVEQLMRPYYSKEKEEKQT